MTKLEKIRYVLTPAIGFGIGGALWGWFFGSAAYYGNPGFAISYYFNGIILGALGGLFLFLFRGKKNVLLGFLLGGIGGLIGFLIGESFGELPTALVVLPINALSFVFNFDVGGVLTYLLYGEVFYLALAGAILGLFYTLVINKKFFLLFPKTKKGVSINFLLLGIGGFWGILIEKYWAIIPTLLLVLVLNYIFKLERRFLVLVLLGMIGFPVAYLMGISIGRVFRDVFEQSFNYWLLWLYVLRFTTAGTILGIFFGLGVWKGRKEASS